MLFPILNALWFYIVTSRSLCAVPNMAVCFFCSSLISCCPRVLLRYFLSDFEMVPVFPLNTDITFAFTFHTRSVSIVRSLYFKIFSPSFLITFVYSIIIIIIIIIIGRSVA